MLDLSWLGKFKDPRLATLCAFLIGLGVGWAAAWDKSTTIHSAERQVFDTVKNDLQRQVTELETINRENGAEMARLREQLSMLSSQQREVLAKRRRELEGFIQRVDKEIAQKREELSRDLVVFRRAPCDGGEKCRPIASEDLPKSDGKIQLERELDALNMQRHEARKKLIELFAQ